MTRVKPLRPIVKEALRFRAEATIREFVEFYEDAKIAEKENARLKAELKKRLKHD